MHELPARLPVLGALIDKRQREHRIWEKKIQFDAAKRGD